VLLMVQRQAVSSNTYKFDPVAPIKR
jgi:hypothetical protein